MFSFLKQSHQNVDNNVEQSAKDTKDAVLDRLACKLGEQDFFEISGGIGPTHNVEL